MGHSIKMEFSLKRFLTQVATTLLYNANGFAGGKVQIPGDNICVPGLNCQYCHYAVLGCPLGVTQRVLGKPYPQLAWQLWGLLVLFGLFLGRLICGWACPFGLFQDLLDKAPFKKIAKNRLTFYLSYLKYAIGIVFIIGFPLYYYLTVGRGLATFCAYLCPMGFLMMNIVTPLVNGDFEVLMYVVKAHKFYIFAFIAILSLLLYRPFCRFICPLGAFYSLFNKIAFLGMRVDMAKCIHCDKCLRLCPMDITEVGDRECIGCGRCREGCPTKAIYLGRR